MNNTTYKYDEAETALYLMEAILDNEPQFISNYRAGHGIAQLRQDLIADCAPKLESAYQAARATVGEHDACFDFDVVPAVLKEVINISGTHLTTSDVWNQATLKVLQSSM